MTGTETQFAVSNTTHLMWIGRWIEVVKSAEGWIFKTGRDAADWLMYGD